VKHFNTFYIATEDRKTAKNLMLDFLLGKDCPNCPEQKGRNSWGWICECITFNAITSVDDFEPEDEVD
jgi:hypothetical protein